MQKNMKKKMKLLLTGAAIGVLAAGVAIVTRHLEIQKEGDNVTIIGSEDGPTSVFLAGKLPGDKKGESKKQETDVATTETSEKPQETLSEQDAFYVSEIPDDVFERMQGKSYKADCSVPREELRYVHILHTGFDGETKEGELVVNRAIADDVLDIFEKLYEASYPIEKVRLVDEYDADDEASMSDNNSSSFNYRCISHTNKISKHGLGMAVDINTLYNPYVKTVDGKLSIEPAGAGDYVDRNIDFPHKIDHDDLCYQLFTEHGFTWGGDWKNSKDYQHFEK